MPNKRDHRAEHLKRTYGITDDDYNAMLAKQNGKCAICKRYRRLSVDHCHAGGNVRGLLCSACNSILGFAKDDAEVLRGAIAYLNKHTGDTK